MRMQMADGRISDEKMKALLQESLVDLPKEIERSVRASSNRDEDNFFSEERKQRLKEKIDLERERRALQAAREEYERKSRRIVRFRIAIACMAALAIVIAVPMTSQTGKKFVTDLVSKWFPQEPKKVQFTGDETKETTDEDEAWAMAADLFGAKRICFDTEEYGNSWIFRIGEYVEGDNEIKLSYLLRGEMISLNIAKNGLGTDKTNILVSGKLVEELVYEKEGAHIRLYQVENGEGQPVSSAEITCGQVLYVFSTGLDYDEFEKVIKNATFE